MLLKIHNNTMKTAIMFHQPNIFSPIFIISEKGKRGPKTSFAVELQSRPVKNYAGWISL